MSSSDQQPELPYIQALCQQIQSELQQDGKSAALTTNLASVQSVFQQCFAALSPTWTETEAAQAQPIQVEINKQLRLLEADSRFLAAARQDQTIQQRKQQIHQRLDLLLRYVDAIAAIQAQSEEVPSDQPG
ncbi:MAG: heterocyst frequency control protein PatD [Elainella sp.]